MTNSQGMNSDVIPERTWIDRKIERAIDRMFAAEQDCWAYRWANLAYRYLEQKRNSPARVRDTGTGLASIGGNRVDDLGNNSTTNVVGVEAP